jgi:hypothetical protein
MHNAPTSVKVLAIIGLVLGAIGALGLVYSFITVFVPIGPPNPILEPLRQDSFYMTSVVLGLIIGIPLLVLLIVASARSLVLKPWARKGMIVYAWLAILQCIVGSVFNFTYLIPKMLSAVPAGAPPEVRAGAIGGAVGGACGSILGLVFPICVLYFFSRQHVVNAFKGIFPASPTNFPVDVQGVRPPPLP